MAGRYLNPQLTQRMPQEIIDKIENFAEDRGITRTKAINEATEFYADSKECVLCGAVNNGNGRVCSCCESRLFSDDEIKEAMAAYLTYATSKGNEWEGMPQMIKEAQKLGESLPNYFDKFIALGLEPQTEYIIDRKGDQTVYRAKIHFVADGIDLYPKDGNGEEFPDIPKEIVYEWACRIIKKKSE